MEGLRAAERESGAAHASLAPEQKKEIAEARRVPTSCLAEREILFRDEMQKIEGPAERQKSEREYQVDRQRINDDCKRAIEAIRRQDTEQPKPRRPGSSPHFRNPSRFR
jgi:hypothetical protein